MKCTSFQQVLASPREMLTPTAGPPLESIGEHTKHSNLSHSVSESTFSPSRLVEGVVGFDVGDVGGTTISRGLPTGLSEEGVPRGSYVGALPVTLHDLDASSDLYSRRHSNVSSTSITTNSRASVQTLPRLSNATLSHEVCDSLGIFLLLPLPPCSSPSPPPPPPRRCPLSPLRPRPRPRLPPPPPPPPPPLCHRPFRNYVHPTPQPKRSFASTLMTCSAPSAILS